MYLLKMLNRLRLRVFFCKMRLKRLLIGNNMNDYESCATDVPQTDRSFSNRRRIRTLAAFWILGLCNNFGYVVMLTAAADIINESASSNGNNKNSARNCTYMSTGAILLADILPSLFIKLLAPFLPFFINLRMWSCVFITGAGFLMVALSSNLLLALCGVVAISLCAGLGEASLLQYSTFYDRNVISTWSSGTGGAGIIGAVSYTILQFLGLRTTLFIMLIVPLTMAITFWILLPKPSDEDIAAALEIQKAVVRNDIEKPGEGFKRKLDLLPGLMKYIIPFTLVYLFEYFINQGLFELIQFNDSDLTHIEQYRWFSVVYQVGVFISRSSVNVCPIRRTWIMAFLQGINVVIFTMEAIYYYIPNFYIVVALVLWEGLLGGATYVNTFYRISKEVPEENKQFSMSITTFGDSIGIAVAGLLSIFAHNEICALPLYNS